MMFIFISDGIVQIISIENCYQFAKDNQGWLSEKYPDGKWVDILELFE